MAQAQPTRIDVEEKQRITVSAPGVEAQTAETIVAADLARAYVARRLGYGVAPSLASLPHASDDLTCEFGVEIYDRMKQDAEVSAALNMLIMACTGSKPKFIPHTDPDGNVNELSQRMADFFDWMGESFETPFNEWRKALVEDGLSYGSGIGELTFALEQSGAWKDHYRISDVRPLCMCDASMVVDNYNKVVGVIPAKSPGVTTPIGAYIPLLTNPYDKQAAENRINSIIPRSKFTIFTWNPKCSDPRGRSILRSIYSAWYSKQQIINLMLEWFKKYSQPSIWATTPEGAQVICEVDDAGNETKIEPTQKLLEALLSFQNSSAIAVPFGSAIHTLDMSKGGDIFLSAISMCNREITRGIQMQHLATSDSEHMARASSSTHQDVLSLFIYQLRQWQAAIIQRDIVRPLVLANWGRDNMHLAPEIDLGDGDGFPIGATEIALLGQINWFSEEQKPKIDKILGLPVRKVTDAPTGVQPLQAPQPQAPTPVPGQAQPEHAPQPKIAKQTLQGDGNDQPA